MTARWMTDGLMMMTKKKQPKTSSKPSKKPAIGKKRSTTVHSKPEISSEEALKKRFLTTMHLLK